jgi:CubicO group peptidase (beta-lactamase class C family)
MKHILFLLLLLANPVVAADIDARAVDRVMNDAMAAWHFPGAAVAIVKDDKVIFVKGYGVKEANGTPITPDTLFEIGSTTKAFTTAAMAILVDEKKMDWDDPVRRHLDYFHLADPCADSLVTLRDIVSHRTGLGRHDELWDNTPLGREDVIRRIGSVRLTKPFRSAYQYQNIMFITAGQAVAAAAKTPWEDFVRTRIFEPLGMSHTRTSVADWNTSEHASGHRWDDESAEVTPHTFVDDDNVAPAGSIKSSARDMAQWIRMQLNDGMLDGKRVVSAEALGETKMPQTVIRVEGTTRDGNPETNLEAYGLGWVIQDYRGELLISHGGALNGFRTQVDLLPHQKAGFVVLINLGRSSATVALRNTLADLLLGRPSRDWNAYYLGREKLSQEKAEEEKRKQEAKRHHDTKPSRELEAYAGTYESTAYGEAVILVVDGGLTLKWSRLTLPLTHVHFDTFHATSEVDDIDEQVMFRLSADGDVASMSVFGEEMVKK